MHPDLQRRVQRYGWDKAVDHYERNWAAQLEPSQELLLRTADLQPNEEVIETACGTGLVTFPAADRVGPDGRVLATDISGRMVDAVRALVDERGIGNVSADRMDAESLDLEDGLFDVGLCSLGLMYYPSPAGALRELHRVIRPGGRVAVSVWGERTHCGWADIFPIVDRRVATDVCPLFFRQGTGETLRHTLEDAGFTGVRLERFSTILKYESFDDACHAAFLGGPVAMAYARFDERTKLEAHEEYRKSIEQYRAGDGYRISGEFVIGWGVRSL